MKSVKKIIFMTAVLALLSVVPSFSQQTGTQLMAKGTTAFKNGKYSESLNSFRDIVIDSSLEDFHSDAYFWIAKSYMALNQLDNAEENLDFFILNFPDNRYYQEALYQKGRLMYLQNDFENCIQENYNFLETFPSSPYAANAYFWIAESLYALGRLEDAERLYSHILYKYPTSYKVESANYRLAMIEQKYREESLIELLKLTHEEYLKSIEEFQIREKTYENALDSYRKKLSLIDSGSSGRDSGQSLSVELLDMQTTLRNKENEIMALKRKIAELEYRLSNAETKLTEAESRAVEVKSEEEKTVAVEPEKKPEQQENLSTEDKLKLLEIKSRALEIKSFYLKYLGGLGD